MDELKTIELYGYEDCVIYAIICKDKNIVDFYVGSSKNIKQRIQSHFQECNVSNIKLYNFIRENGGFENFVFKELEHFSCSSEWEKWLRELEWIEKLNPTLNTYIPRNKLIKEKKTDIIGKLKLLKEYYYTNVIMNVCKMFNIDSVCLKKCIDYTDTEILIEKNENNYKKLVELYDKVKPTIEYIKANDKSDDKIRSKLDNITDFKKVNVLLEKPFSYIGMKILMGRAKPATKQEKCIRLRKK